MVSVPAGQFTIRQQSGRKIQTAANRAERFGTRFHARIATFDRESSRCTWSGLRFAIDRLQKFNAQFVVG